MVKNTLRWPVALFPKQHLQKCRTEGCAFVQTKMATNNRNKKKKKKHNKSYSGLNGGSDRGPGCHTEGPWGQAESNTQPESCWITFPACCSTTTTYSKPGRARGRGYYRAFHCTVAIRLCSGNSLTTALFFPACPPHCM